MGGENSRERVTHSDESDDPQRRHHDGYGQPRTIHEDMEEQDVGYDRREQRQSGRDETIREEQSSPEQLKTHDDAELTGQVKRTHKLSAEPGGRRRGNEVEKAIQAENGKKKSEQIA